MTHSPSPEFQEIPISIGERIVGQATLTTAEIAAFARMCGDHNPLHHDEAYARGTRFGGIIAGGGQLISLTTGLLATYFTQNSAMLGLEFTFHFLKAVMAEETIEMEWEVVRRQGVKGERWWRDRLLERQDDEWTWRASSHIWTNLPLNFWNTLIFQKWV